MAEMRAHVVVWALAILALGFVACARESPSSPGAPTLAKSPSTTTTTTTPHLTISGLEAYGAFLLPYARVQLRAIAVRSDGTQTDCTASAKWVSADERVVAFRLVPGRTFAGSVPAAPGEILAYDKGAAAISATCDDLTGQTLATVDEFTLSGRVTNGSQPLDGVTVEAFRVATTDSAGRFEIHEIPRREIQLVASRPGYMNLAETIVWNGQPTMDVQVPLVPVSGMRILEGEDSLGKSDLLKHSFRLPKPGTLRLDTYFSYDYNDFLFIDLRCDDQLVTSVIQRDTSRGTAFEVPARTDCTYELSFHQQSRYSLFTVQYVLTLTP